MTLFPVPCLTLARQTSDRCLTAVRQPSYRVKVRKTKPAAPPYTLNLPLPDHLVQLRLVLGLAAGPRLPVDHTRRLGLPHALSRIGLYRFRR